jgi:hypothetical protein
MKKNIACFQILRYDNYEMGFAFEEYKVIVINFTIIDNYIPLFFDRYETDFMILNKFMEVR